MRNLKFDLKFLSKIINKIKWKNDIKNIKWYIITMINMNKIKIHDLTADQLAALFFYLNCVVSENTAQFK